LDMLAETPLTRNSMANFSRALVGESLEYIQSNKDYKLNKICLHFGLIYLR
jgi:hypothetical protein